MAENRFHSDVARANFREQIEGRIERIQINIIDLEEQLSDKGNWFARFGIRRNLRERNEQLERYWRRYDRYLKAGLI